jgi:hypothetical protein
METSISPFSPTNQAKDGSCSLRAGKASSSFLCGLCGGIFLPLFMNEEKRTPE